jgi:hypothetical protein
MMFFALRLGCTKPIEYISQNGSDYRLPDTSETASWVSDCLRWLNIPSTPFTGNEGISPSVFPYNIDVDFQIPPLKPLFTFYKPREVTKSTSEEVDLGELLFNVDRDSDARLEALSKQSIWYSRLAVA